MTFDPRTRLAPRSAARSRSGWALLQVLLLALALGLFVAPFLGEQAATDWDAPDPARRVAAPEGDEAPLDVPFAVDVADFDRVAVAEEFGLDGTLAELIRTESARYFDPASPALAQSGLVQVERLAAGEESYVRHCAGCHGLTGDGSGPAARYLQPRPRNFRKGMFKFVSTKASARPRREDLYSTITRGLVGSAMPDFRLLPEERRWDIVEYVRWLSIKGEFEQLVLDAAWQDEELPDAADLHDIVAERWGAQETKEVYPDVPETPYDAASIERGREYFLSSTGASCVACHGEGGKGDGPTADAFADAWGYPIRPRDLTTGVFRSGGSPKQLYLVIANGIQGTPMPGALGVNTAEEIWDMVHFVQSLSAENPSSGAGEGR